MKLPYAVTIPLFASHVVGNYLDHLHDQDPQVVDAHHREHHEHDHDHDYYPDRGGYLQARSYGGAAIPEAAVSGFHNAQQRLDQTINDFQQEGARPGAAVCTNFITSLDGQIDNVLACIGNTLDPITGGLSNVVIGAILGPTFQSITDGVEVLLGNVVGGTADLAIVPAMHMLSATLSKTSNAASKYHMNQYAAKFTKLSQQLAHVADNKPHHQLLARHTQDITDAAKSLNTDMEKINTLTKNLKSKSNPSNSELSSFLEQYEQSVSNGATLVKEAMGKVGPTSNTIKSAIIGPFLTSVIGGSEAFVAAFADSGAAAPDQDLGKRMESVSRKLEELSKVSTESDAKGYATTLSTMSRKLATVGGFSEGGARLLARENVVASGFHNAQQRLDAFVDDFKAQGTRPGAAAVTNFIAGLDGQVDNILGLIANVARPLTGGLSDIAFNFILGPTFQSLTDGVEVLIGNVVGGAADLAIVPAMHILSGSMANLSKAAAQTKMNNYSQKFAQQSKQLAMVADQTSRKAKGGR